MSLIKAERRRFLKRRLTVWMLAIGILILAAITTGLALTHEKPTPQTIAAAEAEAEAFYQQQVKEFERFRAECEAQAGAVAAGKCMGPEREWFKAEHFMPPQFAFKEMFGELLIAWAAIIAMVGFVLGATFVGAEWSSGAMMNLLTWRPKRLTVLGTKLGVVLGWMAGVGVVTFGLWTAGLYAVGKISGNTTGMTSGTWQSFGLSGLRGVAMILAFTAIGFGLASIGRHTALALGVAIAVVIVGQIGLSIVLDLANVPFFERYLIPVHMYTWLNKQVTLEDFSGPVNCDMNGCDAPKLVLQYADTGYMALAAVAAVLVIAFFTMKRRDVA
ncbi:MAG TPA: ABC transporter permease [Micromonosporaceae bacterium]|nr:ABC transporter permease [Micromonosporaceae bacterium]